MAEISTVLLTETQNYPFEAFLSDTGGAAGLFLGLHILGKNIISKLSYISRHCFHISGLLSAVEKIWSYFVIRFINRRLIITETPL